MPRRASGAVRAGRAREQQILSGERPARPVPPSLRQDGGAHDQGRGARHAHHQPPDGLREVVLARGGGHLPDTPRQFYNGYDPFRDPDDGMIQDS